MRCGYSLSSLCDVANVTLVLLYREGVATGEVPKEISSKLDAIEIVRIPQDYPTMRLRLSQLPDSMRTARRALLPPPLELTDYPAEFADRVNLSSGHSFSGMHVYRLRASPVAIRLADRLEIRHEGRVLDLDDIESKTHLRLAQARRKELGRVTFLTEALESRKYRRAETRATRDYAAIAVCSEADRAELESRSCGAKVWAVPNVYGTVDPPSGTGNARNPQSRNILFVGSLDYPPNQDAVRFLLEKVAPSIRHHCPGSRIRIAGRRPPSWMMANCNAAGAQLIADPPTMAEMYADASVVVVPILSGGGTRIKILEAFAFGVPVVSTTLGAEGLEARSGQELVLADDPDQFAKAVGELMNDENMSQRLVAAGKKLLREKYTPDAMRLRLSEMHGCKVE